MDFNLFSEAMNILVGAKREELVKSKDALIAISKNIKGEIIQKSNEVRQASLLSDKRVQIINKELKETNEEIERIGGEIVIQYSNVVKDANLLMLKEMKRLKSKSKRLQKMKESVLNTPKKEAQMLVDLYLEVNQINFRHEIIDAAILIEENTRTQQITFDQNVLSDLKNVYDFFKMHNII